MSDSEPPTPRPRAARLQTPVPRVSASTPDSIVRLLSDLSLQGHGSPHAVIWSAAPSTERDASSSSGSAVSSLRASSHASQGSGRTASTLETHEPLRDPFGLDERSDADSSSGLAASSLLVADGLPSPPSRPRGDADDGQSESGGSVAWSEDLASSTIESFMTDPVAFMAVENPQLSKLQLWQSLCLEFGLCALPAEDVFFDRPYPSASSDSGSEATVLGVSTPSLALVPEAGNHPFPTSLSAANKLLKKHCHVNLCDYKRLRKVLRRARTPAQVQDAKRRIRGLNFPTAAEMKRYTFQNRRFYSLSQAKAGWLNPLLVSF